jgi:hypothetical protein
LAGFTAGMTGFGGSNSSGEKVWDSQWSTSADARTEVNFPFLKNTEYVGRPAFVDEVLRKHTIQGSIEIGSAAIGPATSNGAMSFSCSAALRKSAVDKTMIGGGSSFFKGSL